MAAGPTMRALQPVNLAIFVRRDMIWPALALLIAAAALISDSFFTAGNLVNVLRQATIIGIVATGMTVPLLAGHFDLSVGATVTLAAVVAIALEPVGAMATALAIAIPLGLGAAVGAANGWIVGRFRANSIIVTVGMQFIIGALVLIGVKGQHVRVDGATALFTGIAEGSVLGIPVPVVLLLAIVAAAHVAMTRTRLGRHILAVGSGWQAARRAGVRVTRTVMAAFVISGACAALAGIVVAARVRNLDPTAGIGYEFAALTAVVLGGARLTGGGGRVVNSLAGVLMLGVLANLMTLGNVAYSNQLLVQGVLLVTAVAAASAVSGERSGP
jgi:ribose transport system permease protein